MACRVNSILNMKTSDFGISPLAFVVFIACVISASFLISMHSASESQDLRIIALKNRVYNVGHWRGNSFQIDTAKYQYIVAKGDINFSAKEWSVGMSYEKIQVGMMISKNEGSDTIAFLDSNRNYIGFVVFE